MMKRVGFLLDMDGVIYRGDQLIEGTVEFLNRLRTLSIPYMFLTNNSQRARRDVVRKLARLGIEAQDSQISSRPAQMRFPQIGFFRKMFL